MNFRRLLVLIAGTLLVGAAAAHAQTALDPFETYATGFQDLRGIVVDDAGRVFVADRHAGTVTRIAPDRSTLIVASGLQQPIGLALDDTGRVLVAESGTGRVIRLEPGGGRTTMASGLPHPRWVVRAPSGTLYVSVRPRSLLDPESWLEPDRIVAVSSLGTVTLFADGFRGLEGLALTADTLYAATLGLMGELSLDGVVFRIPIRPDGTAGAPTAFGPREPLKRPVGLALDRLGALYVSTRGILLEDDSRRAITKLHADGTATSFATGLRRNQGIAFDATGNLYLAAGRPVFPLSATGRVLRFLAPASPSVTAPPFTSQSPESVTGTTAPGARVDLFANDAATPVTVVADSAGHFTASLPLTLNTENALDVCCARQLMRDRPA